MAVCRPCDILSASVLLKSVDSSAQVFTTIIIYVQQVVWLLGPHTLTTMEEFIMEVYVSGIIQQQCFVIYKLG